MVSISDVDALVCAHYQLVAYQVRQLMGKLPPHVDRDDLTSAGLTALVISAQAYDPERISSFAGFASARIRWALLDELRSLDWATRSTRSRARKVDAVRQDLIAVLARTPTMAELADALGMAVREVEDVTESAHRASVLSLQGLAPESVGELLSDRAPGPEDVMLLRERIGYLRDAVKALPQRLRTVVVRYFLQERPMAEIATELGVTESRVSQMRAQALALLRDGINAQLDPDLVPPVDRLDGALIARRRNAYYAQIAASGDLRSRLAVTSRLSRVRRGCVTPSWVPSPRAQPPLRGDAVARGQDEHDSQRQARLSECGLDLPAIGHAGLRGSQRGDLLRCPLCPQC